MTNDRTRAFWVTGAGRGEIRNEPLAQPAAGEVLVRARYGGVSRGTEALVFRGGVPASEFERMRAPFQAGDFPAPVKYGYINVGIVERGPDALLGRHVFCLYPHQTRYVVPADAVHPLPDALPPERAILAAYAETAVNGLWDAAPALGDRISIVGAGTLGCLTAWLAGRIPGCDVTLIDVDAGKAPLAAALGVGFAPPERAAGEADLVIHTSGDPAGLSTALALAGFEAKVLEMSWFGERRSSLALGEAFHSRRLTLRSSQVGALPAGRRARWTRRRRMALALELLCSSGVVDRLIGGESRFEQLPEVLARLSATPGHALCERIVYPA